MLPSALFKAFFFFWACLLVKEGTLYLASEGGVTGIEGVGGSGMFAVG